MDFQVVFALLCLLRQTMAGFKTPKALQLSQTLSRGESAYVAQRRERIHKWLQSQGIECDLEHLPRVALLGSGGGARAMVGLLGSLQQLIQDDLMDGILYIAGVSGSTWCLSSVYGEAGWSSGVSERCADVVDTLQGHPLPFSHALQWLQKRWQQDPYFTLTDFWSAYITSQIIKEMDDSPLSAQGSREANDPYPIYNSIDLDVFREGNVAEVLWFEMTPNDSGFTELGAYLPTSLLISQSEGGPQMDMILLQGICGSALANVSIEDVSDVTSEWMWNLVRGIAPHHERISRDTGECGGLPSQVINSVSKLTGYAGDPNCLMNATEVTEEIIFLEQLLDGLQDSEGKPLFKMDPDSWQNMALATKKEYIHAVSRELIHTAPTWTQVWHGKPFADCIEAMEEMTKSGRVKKRSLLADIKDLAWVTKHIFPLLREEWGTTSNFVYNNKDLIFSHLPGLVHDETIHLVDAGLKMNLAFPPVLRAQRKVDLIISLDFSENDPFESLFLGRGYAQQHKLPFPKVEDSLKLEVNHPQDFYVFRARNSDEPTVIHMPLFNLQNCEDERDIRTEKLKFRTFQSAYSSSLIMELLEKARTNLRNNKDKILNEIIKASVTNR